MLRAITANGSPLPVFETDAERSFFRVTFFAHQAFANNTRLPDMLTRTTKRYKPKAMPYMTRRGVFVTNPRLW
jgi:hypothetical protein